MSLHRLCYYVITEKKKKKKKNLPLLHLSDYLQGGKFFQASPHLGVLHSHMQVSVVTYLCDSDMWQKVSQRQK